MKHKWFFGEGYYGNNNSYKRNQNCQKKNVAKPKMYLS